MTDFTLYDLATLDGVFRRQKVSSKPFYLGAFNRQINFDTPEIAFESVSGDDRGLAPFVLPTIQGRPQKLSGYSVKRFRPAYVKIKDVVDVRMHIERMPGETPITGSMTIMQRRDAVIAELLRMQRVKFQNRQEWMAAQALITGAVTISGEDYPTVVLDFGRDSNLTVVNSGTAVWSNAAADPLADLKATRAEANGLSGAVIRKVVFGQTAWDNFCARVDLRDMMDKTGGGYATNVQLMNDGFEGQEYMGRISGAFGGGAWDLWVDNSKYLDENETEQFYLDPTWVCGYAEVSGVRCFGAIMDADAQYKPFDYFFKNWRNQDPSVEYLLGQAAPLMVPKNPNASFVIKTEG